MTRRNAIILAAGTASRFVPLSQEYPKGLLEVKGEVLIERQIRQLKEAGVQDITIVVGYKDEMFSHLKDNFGVDLVYNEDYARYNNTSSMIRVLDRLGDTFICSSDNYFTTNVFRGEPRQSYYSALFASGLTSEYCIQTDAVGNIIDVGIGGSDSWYMVGHVYFSRDFSERFSRILMEEYSMDETRLRYWEDVYIAHIHELPPMKINRYQENEINEFDTLDELRTFDSSYIEDTRSGIIKKIADRLECRQGALTRFRKLPQTGNGIRFSFIKDNDTTYIYDGDVSSLTKI